MLCCLSPCSLFSICPHLSLVGFPRHISRQSTQGFIFDTLGCQKKRDILARLTFIFATIHQSKYAQQTAPYNVRVMLCSCRFCIFNRSSASYLFSRPPLITENGTELNMHTFRRSIRLYSDDDDDSDRTSPLLFRTTFDNPASLASRRRRRRTQCLATLLSLCLYLSPSPSACSHPCLLYHFKKNELVSPVMYGRHGGTRLFSGVGR